MRLSRYYNMRAGGFQFRLYRARGKWRAQVRSWAMSKRGPVRAWLSVRSTRGEIVEMPTKRDMRVHIRYAFEGK